MMRHPVSPRFGDPVGYCNIGTHPSAVVEALGSPWPAGRFDARCARLILARVRWTDPRRRRGRPSLVRTAALVPPRTCTGSWSPAGR
jgi:hypothetical protein